MRSITMPSRPHQSPHFIASLAPLALALMLAFGSSIAHAKPLPPQALPEVETLMRENQLDQANLRIKEWIKVDPGNAPLHYYLAQVKAAQGDWDAAAAMLKKAKYFDWRMKFASSKQKVLEFENVIVQHQHALQGPPNSIPVLTDKIVPSRIERPIEEPPVSAPAFLDHKAFPTEMFTPVMTEPVVRAIKTNETHDLLRWLLLLGVGVAGTALGVTHWSQSQQQKKQRRVQKANLQETTFISQQLCRELEDMLFIAPFQEQYGILNDARTLLQQVKQWEQVPQDVTSAAIEHTMNTIKTYRNVLYPSHL